MDYRTAVAKELLRIGAVFFRPDQPFTWASGIKSPIYCDNRLIFSDPVARDVVERAISRIITVEYPECEALMGTSTAGIGHAAIAAMLLGLPMGYVRSGAKTHGRENSIEGKLEKGQKVVVVEDLISTGGSAIATANILREAGADVLGIVSIVTYNMKIAAKRLEDAGLVNHSTTDFDKIAAVAAEEGYIASDDIQRLIAFRNNPNDESWITKK